MTQQRITVIRGDGIGPDIIDATTKILDKVGCDFAYDYADAGLVALEEHGVPVRALVSPDRDHFTYGPGIGQPAFVIVEDVLAVEIVQFASDIVGPTPEMVEAGKAARP